MLSSNSSRSPSCAWVQPRPLAPSGQRAARSDPLTLVTTRSAFLDTFGLPSMPAPLAGASRTIWMESPEPAQDKHRLQSLCLPSGPFSIILPHLWNPSAAPESSKTYACGGILGTHDRASVPQTPPTHRSVSLLQDCARFGPSDGAEVLILGDSHRIQDEFRGLGYPWFIGYVWASVKTPASLCSSCSPTSISQQGSSDRHPLPWMPLPLAPRTVISSLCRLHVSGSPQREHASLSQGFFKAAALPHWWALPSDVLPSLQSMWQCHALSSRSYIMSDRGRSAGLGRMRPLFSFCSWAPLLVSLPRGSVYKAGVGSTLREITPQECGEYNLMR